MFDETGAEAPLDPPTDILKTCFTFDVANPKQVDLSGFFGPRTPADTKNLLREGGAQRREMVEALGRNEPSPIMAAVPAYVGTAMRLAATETVLDMEDERKEAVTGFIKFQWTSVLDNRPRGAIWNTHRAFTDAAYALNALGMAHCNAASKLMATAGGDIVDAHKHLKSAAGVFDYVFTQVLTPNKSKLPDARPPELVLGVVSCLRDACLAMSQQYMAFKAESEKKPASLIAKLCKGIADKYHAALSNIQKGVSRGEYAAMDPRFMETMTVMTDVSKALAHKFLGRAHYDKGEYGEAVYHMKTAKVLVQTVLRRGIHNSEISKRVKAEAEHIASVCEMYELENRTIYFATEPAANSIPPMKGLFACKPTAFDAGSTWGDVFEVPSVEAPPPPPPSTPPPAASAGGKTEEDVFVFAKKPTAPEGRKSMKFACSGCAKLMEAPAGSPAVACPHCKKVNINIACGACDKVVSFLQGATRVRCPGCNIINRTNA